MTIAETDRERERENLDKSTCCIPSGLLLQGEAVNALCKDGIIVSGMPAAKDNNLEKCDLEDRALAVGSFEFVKENLQSCISKLNWLLERIGRLPVACSRTVLNIVRFSVSQKVAHLLCVLDPAQTCTTQDDVLLVDAFDRMNDLSHLGTAHGETVLLPLVWRLRHQHTPPP